MRLIWPFQVCSEVRNEVSLTPGSTQASSLIMKIVRFAPADELARRNLLLTWGDQRGSGVLVASIERHSQLQAADYYVYMLGSMSGIQ